MGFGMFVQPHKIEERYFQNETDCQGNDSGVCIQIIIWQTNTGNKGTCKTDCQQETVEWQQVVQWSVAEDDPQPEQSGQENHV